MGEKTVFLMAGGGCCCALVITSIVLFSVAWGVIEPREYGIVYDDTAKSIWSDDVRESGRYMVGVAKRFITFPRGFQTIDFSNSESADAPRLACWTSDGQNVFLDMSVQLTLNKDKLIDLYAEMDVDWRKFAIGTVYDTIKWSTTGFNTISFFTDRNNISTAIFDNIQAEFAKEKFFKLEKIQLRNILVPSAFQTAIVKKILELQQKQIEQFNQEEKQIRQTIAWITASAESYASVELAEATALADYNIAVQQAELLKEITELRATKYKELADGLVWTGANRLKLVHFFAWSRLIKNNAAVKTKALLGFDKAMLNF